MIFTYACASFCSSPTRQQLLITLCVVLSVGIKLATFDTAKTMLGHANSAYDEELLKWRREVHVKESSSGVI